MKPSVMLFVVLALQGLLAGCVRHSELENYQPGEEERYTPDWKPIEQSTERSGVEQLILEALQSAESGEMLRAFSLAERAQRMAARDARVYLLLAELHHRESRFDQARDMAERGVGFAKDKKIRRRLTYFTDNFSGVR